jgi:hypothetical protein
MGKYTPLETYLAKQPESEVAMSFDDIERVIGSKLPPSARQYRAWWSNNERSSSITRSWARAGFASERVDMDRRTLIFQRVANRYPAGGPGAGRVADPAPAYAVRGRHPLRGALKGTIRVARGTDLTAPADPDWEHDPR